MNKIKIYILKTIVKSDESNLKKMNKKWIEQFENSFF